MVTERKKQRVAIKTVREILLDVSRSIKRQKVYRLSVFERQRATVIVERENEREREKACFYHIGRMLESTEGRFTACV